MFILIEFNLILYFSVNIFSMLLNLGCRASAQFRSAVTFINRSELCPVHLWTTSPPHCHGLELQTEEVTRKEGINGKTKC